MGLIHAFPQPHTSYPTGLSAFVRVPSWTLSQLLAMAPVAEPPSVAPALQTQTFLAPSVSPLAAVVDPQLICIASPQLTIVPTSLPPAVDGVLAVPVVELALLAALVFPVLVVVVRVPR